MRRLATYLELGLVLMVFFLLAAFVGPPPSNDTQTGSPVTPSVPRVSQSEIPASWDRNLRLPGQSDRIANYTMDVVLNTETNTISGWEILEWKNTTGRFQSDFPFHLYHNAWKNNRSTFARENDWRLGRVGLRNEDLGYTNVKSVTHLDRRGETDVTSTLRFIQPDDDNPDDQTVFQVSTPRPVPPGGTLHLKIEFETKQPLALRRTGVVRDYHFVAQWFPKIGVWWKGEWNCRQFHNSPEFFADYGVYDVKITIPATYVIGATGGIPKEEVNNRNGTKTVRFIQEDVHDFAWVTAPDLVRSVRTFVHRDLEPGENPERHHRLRDVTVILLSQPHHDNLIDRYFEATFNAIRYYGEWYGEYPYETLTVVDPANDSRSGGMEYPTLFTGGGNMFAPKEQPSPESVTVHEFGHQFWYAMVGNNEFEEAWLDEGFNTYSQDKVLQTAWPPFRAVRYFFGGPGAGTYVGFPYVFHEVSASRYELRNLEVRRMGKNDVMARRGWEYYRSYSLNSYTKPALSLHQLEQYLGEETMYRVMRTYHHRYRFKHPTSQDFINTVNEISGRNMNWFFEQTWFSSNLFDYSIDAITNRLIPPPRGIFDSMPPDAPATPGYESTVVVKREGEAIAPVDVLVVFEDGRKVREFWDGVYRWKKYVYHTDSPVRYAVVDPGLKLAMDVNYNNNSKVSRPRDFRSLSARKLASQWMFWVQNYLEFAAFWH
ncbi:MAG: M1 family metallopeptidase [Ignavibacteriales bacterium]|nr:M1 family metallopeptidase [Ignavibacteriales bacterium]